MGVLSEDDVTRLVKLLGMMGSTHDGEVRNAARLAQRLIAGLGLTWEDVLNGSGGRSEDDIARLVKESYDYGFEQGARAQTQAQATLKSKIGEDIGSWRYFCQCLLDDYRQRLTAWEVDFCEGFLERGWPRPTDKQKAVFERIANKCCLELPQ